MSTLNQNLLKQQLPLIKAQVPSPYLKAKLKYKAKQGKQKKNRGGAIEVKLENDVFYSDDDEDKDKKLLQKRNKNTTKMELDRGNNIKLHSKTLSSLEVDQIKTHEQITKTVVLKRAQSKNMPTLGSNISQQKPVLRKKRQSRKDLDIEPREQCLSSTQCQPSHFSTKKSLKTNTNELKKQTQSSVYPQPRLRALPNRMQQRIELAYEEDVIKQAEQAERLTAQNFTKMIHGENESLQDKLLNKLVNNSLVCWPDYVSYFERECNTSYDEFKSKLNYLKSQYLGKRLLFEMQEEELNYSIYQIKTDPIQAKFYQQRHEILRQARFDHFSERYADQSIDMEPFYRENRSRSRDNRRRKYHQNSSDSHERSCLRQDQDKKSFNLQDSSKQQNNQNQFVTIEKNVSDGILQKSTRSVSQLQRHQKIDNNYREKFAVKKIEQQNQSYTQTEPRFDSINQSEKKTDEKPNVNEGKQYGRSRALVSEFQSKIGSRDIEKQLSRINDRKKILATIQVLNRKSEQQQKLHRPEEREDKQRPKLISKQASNNVVNVESVISKEQFRREHSPEESDSRKYESSVRDSGLWITGQSKGQKVKRLQILNRYHYNPFEENEGEDHCEVWKKLMCAQINSVRSQYNFNTKTQEFQNSMIDSLLADVDRIDKGRVSHYGKLTEQDFYVKTSYKPNEQKREDTSSVAKSKTSLSGYGAMQASPVKVENLTNTKTRTNSSNNRNKMIYGLEIEREDSVDDRSLVKEQFPPEPEQPTNTLQLVNSETACVQKIVGESIVEEELAAHSTRGKEQQSSEYVDDLEHYYENIFQ